MIPRDSTPSRVVAHLDLDTFFVSVERLRDRRLAGKPILIGGHSDRAVVAACGYETRRFGVHSAMHLARRLCPEVLVIRGDYDAYDASTAYGDRPVTGFLLPGLFLRASLAGTTRLETMHSGVKRLKHLVFKQGQFVSLTPCVIIPSTAPMSPG